MYLPSIAIVTAPTRMQGLLSRWGTKGAARFRLNRAVLHQDENQATTKHKAAGARSSLATTDSPAPPSSMPEATFSEYEREEELYQTAIESIRREVEVGYPVTMVPRQHIPNFDFSSVIAVIVVGQDGLVANVGKYAMGLPIIGVNPDPSRIDGILVPFHVNETRRQLQRVIADSANISEVTLARATLNDGQTMLAFNDLFIGRRTHVSARYTLQVGQAVESHSSSGVIVATGAGSTGWLSSVFNMAAGVSSWVGAQGVKPVKLKWEDRQLAWVVREPFASKHSSVRNVAGLLPESEHLTMASLMPESGVIFSDGIENDFLEFNSGSILRVEVAKEVARLVVR